MPTKKPLKPPVPVICIQEIETSWTKLSRGGEGAVKRGHVPEAAELPLPVCVESLSAGRYPFFLHLLDYQESAEYKVWSQFARSDIEANVAAEILNRDGVRISFDGTILTARYQWTEDLGAPRRRRQDNTGTFVNVGHSDLQKALGLEVGQWGRILHNGRTGGSYAGSTWRYSEYIFNIGLFIDPQPDVFLTSQPVKTYSKMAHLF